MSETNLLKNQSETEKPNQQYFDTTDIANTNEDFKRGDVVKMYKEGTALRYPCVVLKCDELQDYRVEVLKGVLGAKTLTSDQDSTDYNVYIHMGDDVVFVGQIPNERMKFLLVSPVFSPYAKTAHLDKGTTITGDMLFALCTA